MKKRNDFANAHMRARVLKQTRWPDEEKTLLQTYGKFGYDYPQTQYEKLFELGVISQPPRSPDFNILTAGVFAYLERMQQQHGALSYEDLRKSVEISYKELTDEVVTKVCNAVRVNFKVAIKQQGGNWYIEHRHRDRVAEQKCCRCLAT